MSDCVFPDVGVMVEVVIIVVNVADSFHADAAWARRRECAVNRGGLSHLIYQREISRKELVEAHMKLCNAFERLYHNRLPSRLHFVRQCLHYLLHVASETVRLGPGGCYSWQWTMECTIGNLGEEIKQHTDPYTNLSQRATRRAQVNSLKSLIPDLEPDELPSIRFSQDLRDE